MKKYQIVKWFPEWHGFHFIRPKSTDSMRYIYDWFLFLGFWEIRKWSTKKFHPLEEVLVEEWDNEYDERWNDEAYPDIPPSPDEEENTELPPS